jgi:hypothetical protein
MKHNLIPAVALLALAGCYEEDATGILGGGITSVHLTDAPFPYDSVDRVEVYVVSIAASHSTDTTGPGSSGWTTITAPRKRFDLLELQQGKTEFVGSGQLPAGQYRAVRMVIDTDSSGIYFYDGRKATVHWPVSGALTLNALVESPVSVHQAGTDIVIDFDVGRSFVPGNPLVDLPPGYPPPNDEFIFIPWIRAVNRAATGAIEGKVLGDRDGDGDLDMIPNAAITVYRANDTSLALYTAAATGHTGPDGYYKVAFLPPGDYHVQADPLGIVQLQPGMSTNVTVSAGSTTPNDVILEQRNLEYIYIEGLFAIDTGQSTTLTVRVGDSTGKQRSNPVVTWTSSKPSVATISGTSSTAVLTGIAPGSTEITATCGDQSVSVTIYVFASDSSGSGGGAVANVTLTPANATVAVGDSLGFYASLTNATGGTLVNRPVQWVVEDSTVVWTIGAFGQSLILRAAKPGTTRVIATSEGVADTANVVVTP